MFDPATDATKLSLATVRFTLGSSTEIASCEITTGELSVSEDKTCTMAFSCITNALVAAGKFSSKSVPSTNTTYSRAVTSPTAPRNGLTTTPSTVVPAPGDTVPFFVLIDHDASVDLITSIVFFTFVSLPQKGHVPVAREAIEVKSRYPSPPVHALGSFAGSLPENEKRHSFLAKSISTKRFFPGQFESYTCTTAWSESVKSMAYGSTA